MSEKGLRFLSIALLLLLISCGGGGSNNGSGLNGGSGSQTLLTTSLQADYFAAPVSDPDFTCTASQQTTGLVGSQLGVDGFPVVTAASPLHDTDSSGQLLWWSTKQAGIISEVTGKADALPLNISTFFANGQSNDLSLLRTAHWKGTVTAPTTGSLIFNVTSDDDLWIFLDKTLVVDDGGIHSLQPATDHVVPITAGSHTLDIFYADRCPQAATVGVAVREQ